MQKLLVSMVLGMSAVLGGCAGEALDASYSSSGTQTSRPSTGATSSVAVTQSSSGAQSSATSSQGGSYQAVGSNPFTVTAHDPLSTFAADVDTASYDIFRRDIQNSSLESQSSKT